MRGNVSSGPLPPPECDLGLPFIESQCIVRAEDPHGAHTHTHTATESDTQTRAYYLSYVRVPVCVCVCVCVCLCVMVTGDARLPFWHKSSVPIIPLPPPRIPLAGWRDPYVVGKSGAHHRPCGCIFAMYKKMLSVSLYARL